jgi:hypothetical protein
LSDVRPVERDRADVRVAPGAGPTVDLGGLRYGAVLPDEDADRSVESFVPARRSDIDYLPGHLKTGPDESTAADRDVTLHETADGPLSFTAGRWDVEVDAVVHGKTRMNRLRAVDRDSGASVVAAPTAATAPADAADADVVVLGFAEQSVDGPDHEGRGVSEDRLREIADGADRVHVENFDRAARDTLAESDTRVVTDSEAPLTVEDGGVVAADGLGPGGENPPDGGSRDGSVEARFDAALVAAGSPAPDDEVRTRVTRAHGRSDGEPSTADLAAAADAAGVWNPRDAAARAVSLRDHATPEEMRTVVERAESARSSGRDLDAAAAVTERLGPDRAGVSLDRVLDGVERAASGLSPLTERASAYSAPNLDRPVQGAVYTADEFELDAADASPAATYRAGLLSAATGTPAADVMASASRLEDEVVSAASVRRAVDDPDRLDEATVAAATAEPSLDSESPRAAFLDGAAAALGGVDDPGRVVPSLDRSDVSDAVVEAVGTGAGDTTPARVSSGVDRG